MTTLSADRTAEPGFLAERRARAAELVGELELPTFRGRPGWEFTSLEGLDLDAFPAVGTGDLALARSVAAVLEAPEGAVRLDQVDATYAPGPELDSEGPLVLPLSEAFASHPEVLAEHFGSIVAADDPFVARNEAGWAGGAFVYVPRGVTVEAPIVVTAVHATPDAAAHWRTLVVLEDGAEAEVWEQHLSRHDEQTGLVTTVVELSVGQGASLRYVGAQGLSSKTWVFGSQRAVVQRDGTLDWILLGFGSANGRVAVETNLAGEGAEGRVTGAYATNGRQHLDYATTQEHAAPRTNSDLAFRGILADRSQTVWSGMIKVDPGAQQIDAFQESRNLLLSKKAHADAIPGLEILANDVRCTHAAAIAQLDAEQLYYLRAHGLPEGQAKRLVIEGFLQATVERFDEGPVRDAVAAALDRRLEAVLG